MKRIAIIGAGYAGMAAAVTLAAAGEEVTVFETAHVLGGRARKVAPDKQRAAEPSQGERTPFEGAATAGSVGGVVDNGQHILIGAYRDTLRLMRQVGLNPETALLRRPLTLSYPGFSLHAPPLPAPLHLVIALLCTRGLTWSEKFAAIRLMQWLKRQNFRLGSDTTVTALLDTHAQPAALRRYLWEPLCISALNTPADAASAQVFVHVLRDSLAAERSASDLLIPRVDLSALFPEAAARYVEAHGGTVRTRSSIASITRSDEGFSLGSDTHYSHVIAAVGPHHLPRLLAGHPELAPLSAQVAALQWEPIVTCYLRYPSGTRLPQPMLGLCDGHVHWVFDRGQLDGSDGLFAAVISARGRHSELSREDLAAAVHAELKTLTGNLPAPLSAQVITEKRATFACTPNLARPSTLTAVPGLLLAGDYVASDYPATLESAVRSGLAAAHAIIG